MLSFKRFFVHLRIKLIVFMLSITRPKILISNDDGYQAKGLRALVSAIADMADITICAPDSARSGYSCAFSAAMPLRLTPQAPIQGHATWSCSGTPVDCIKIALDRLYPDHALDMIIGGINHGDNASVNTHYSGTMGLTMEGCLKSIPSVAFSLCDHDLDADFTPLREIIRKIVAKVLEHKLPKGVCLNVNFPATPTFKGIKICRMAYGSWLKECDTREHPSGYPYYWMTGYYNCDEPEAEDTDRWALSHGYVSVTPTRMDVTAHEHLTEIKSWLP